ncbi:MAG: IMPACT family protein [Lutibacter sp.]
MDDTYLTIKKEVGDILFKEKGSKFISYAFPVLNEEEVKNYLVEIKKKHHAARHWCYAYRIGESQIIYRVNDDGEPNNTAGQPIYGQILSKNLTNVLVIVVRYFGGTKLGVGGLITAYKTSAKMVLDEIDIVTKTIDKKFRLIFSYANMNKVMKIIKDYNLQIVKQKMELNCEFEVLIRMKKANQIKNLLQDLRCVDIKELTN